MLFPLRGTPQVLAKDPLFATVLTMLGLDNERFTFRYQGLDQRLTDVEPSRVIRDLIA